MVLLTTCTALFITFTLLFMTFTVLFTTFTVLFTQVFNSASYLKVENEKSEKNIFPVQTHKEIIKAQHSNFATLIRSH